jgi:flavin-dependent dehydrogenase
MDDEVCDVLVIGAGPAGSTAAALLAEQSIDVVLLERDAHPRFHIGESLLPRNLEIFERLGVHAEVAAMGIHKPGAEFISDETGERVAFPFAHSLNKSFTHAYQVRRSEFDSALATNAVRRGARLHERTRAVEVEFAAAGGRHRVKVINPDGTDRWIESRFILDASGRDGVIASKLRTRVSNKHINNAAVFAHYRGIVPQDGETTGYISIHLSENGWFWMIPLTGEVMSVGFVGNPAAYRKRGSSMEQFFNERIAASPCVSARMEGAERISDVHTTGNYSYCAQQAWGDGWLMIGDAFAFLDPVFSSGVLLAMTGGQLGAETAAAWLQDPLSGREAAKTTERRLRTQMQNLSWLIYRINAPVMRDMFMAPSNFLHMRDGIINMLAGNLERSWRSLLPVWAVKTTYYTFCAARRFGWRPYRGTMAREDTIPQPTV